MGDEESREISFYRRLLDLVHVEQLEPLLEEALQAIVEMSDAQHAVLTLHPDRIGQTGRPLWYFHACTEEEKARVQDTISKGIVAEALERGDTVHTASALLDERFRDRTSVRDHKIEAVLCVPVGAEPTMGAVYLGGRPGHGLFSLSIVDKTQLLARHVGQVAHRLLVQGEQGREDPTLPWRKRLRADEDIIGRSSAIARVLREVSHSAPLDITVLLTGPSGTGKTVLARVLALNSQRAAGPFVEINCAAIPDALFESELFGARRGAYSGAQEDLPGKIQAAEGGTLFLDEVGELSLGAQAKFLQFLQSKTYYRLGSTDLQSADVRVVAATNVDLKEAVKDGRFREDLYYRLDDMPIPLPSLSEREEDIPLLVRYFVQESARRHKLPELRLSPAAMTSLQTASWPSNLRGLSKAVGRGLIRAAAEGVRTIEPQHLSASGEASDPNARPSFQEATRIFQRGLLQESLSRTKWNIAETARELDLTRSYVYKLIEGHGFKRPKS